MRIRWIVFFFLGGGETLLTVEDRHKMVEHTRPLTMTENEILTSTLKN